ncbi:hypothetical protein [Streptomyces sp. CoH17]|uniref:hypothetical protein n=1 Tax=Streptomyces sp. CoH17 TaxID=2992806 RepID=UPI00226DCC51|nr:hypothetical protein [Streptomyces sp. CoH17]
MKNQKAIEVREPSVSVNVEGFDMNTILGWTIDYDGEEATQGEPITVADKVVKQIVRNALNAPEYTSLKEKVTRIREEVIREEIRPIVREALQAPIRRTNYYGEATGPETTLSEIIMKEAKDAWTLPKDSYRSKVPFLVEIVRDEVQKAFKTLVTDEIQKVRVEVGSEISKVITGQVNSLVEKGILSKG